MNLVAGGGDVTGCSAAASPGGTAAGSALPPSGIVRREDKSQLKKEEFAGSIPATLGSCPASTSSYLGSWFRNPHGYFLGVPVTNK